MRARSSKSLSLADMQKGRYAIFSGKIYAIIKIIIIFAVVIFWILPMVGVVINSFRTPDDVAGTGWWTILKNPNFTFKNFKTMLEMKDFYSGFLNSILITIPTVFLVVLVSSAAAFGLIWTELPGRRIIYAFIAGMIIVPPEITLYPTLVILKAIHLVNTYPGIWMSHVASVTPFGVFLMGTFISQIPKDLIEAAKIDGASTLSILLKIIIPLSGSAMASLAILDFLWVWNDLLRALVIIPDPSIRPLTAVLANTAGGYGEFITVQAAGAVLLMLPPLIVFMFSQKSFVRGVLAGAVKA